MVCRSNVLQRPEPLACTSRWNGLDLVTLARHIRRGCDGTPSACCSANRGLTVKKIYVNTWTRRFYCPLPYMSLAVSILASVVLFVVSNSQWRIGGGFRRLYLTVDDALAPFPLLESPSILHMLLFSVGVPTRNFGCTLQGPKLTVTSKTHSYLLQDDATEGRA